MRHNIKYRPIHSRRLLAAVVLSPNAARYRRTPHASLCSDGKLAVKQNIRASSIRIRYVADLLFYFHHLNVGLVRPPDIHVGGLIFTTDSFFYLLSFFLFFAVWSPSSLNRTQPYPATWSEVSVIWKRISIIWGIPSPYKWGVQKPPFLDDFATQQQL